MTTTEIVAQGIAKTVVLAKQSAKGVPADSGGQYLRRITYVAQAERDTFENNEIVQHQQSTGISYGLKKVSAKLNGLLSAGTYALLFAGLLRKDFVAGATTSAQTNITTAVTSGAMGTFTRGAGSYLTDGFKIGDIVRGSGWASPATGNNSRNALIIALTATVMTVLFFDGNPMIAKASGDSVTIAVVGKKTLAPLTGHTSDYFTMEDWYATIEKSELFSDVQPSQIEVASPATGNVTCNIDFAGIHRTRDGEQVLDAATAAPTGNPPTAVNGLIFANGEVYDNINSLKLTLNGNVTQGEAVIGSDTAYDLARGRIAVSGEFQALFKDDDFQVLYDGETPLSIVGVMMVNKHDGTSQFVSFSLGRIKLTGDAPDDGEKLIVRTYPFTAEININGGAALAWDQTIISVQDSTL